MGPETPLAGHNGAEPPIDAEAGETSAIHGDHPVDPPVPAGESVEPPVEHVEEPVTGSEPSEAAAESDAKAEEEEELAAWEPIPERVAEKPRKNSPMMVAAGVAVIGLAGYYGLSQFVASPESPEPITAPAPVVMPPKHAEVRPDIAPTKPVPAETHKAERATKSPAPAEPMKKSEGPVAPETKAAEAPSAEAALTAKLAATQAALESAMQKLQALEGQAAAPKATRARRARLARPAPGTLRRGSSSRKVC